MIFAEFHLKNLKEQARSTQISDSPRTSVSSSVSTDSTWFWRNHNNILKLENEKLKNELYEVNYFLKIVV